MILNIFWGLAFLLLFAQIFTSLTIIRRFKRGSLQHRTQAIEPVTVIRPFCGLEHRLEECLLSSFSNSAKVQVIFCVSNPNDPAIPLVKKLVEEYPEHAILHVGEYAISSNPKLNNMAGGYPHSKHEWVLMVDSNVILPEDYIEQAFSNWEQGTGLVTSPAHATDMQNIPARFEAAFLNSNQARLQLFADELGMGFTQGKFIFWKKELLEKGGGLPALGDELAEDIAATKMIRRMNMDIRLLNKPATQPLGVRDLKTVWSRQVRWARVRRVGLPWIYAGEIFNGIFLPLLAFIFAGASLSMIALFIAFWYGVEWALARFAGWSHRPMDIALWMLRDFCLPIIWAQGYMGSSFEWRGNLMRKDGDNLLLEAAETHEVRGEA